MKKKLALFMTMMLTMSMIPFSSFAVEDDDNVYVVDGAPRVAQDYNDEEVTVVIDLGDYTSLREGYVDLNLKNARLANVKEPIKSKIVQGDKEILSGTKLKFSDRFEDELSGGETEIVMQISGETIENKSKDNIKIFLMMKLDFTESSLGDVDLEIVDRNQNGVGNHEETIAYQVGSMQRDTQIIVNEQNVRVSKDGGMLSAFMIKNLDRLDSVKSNNSITIKLPNELKFDKETRVELDGYKIEPSYDEKMNKLTINGVDSKNKIITVMPKVMPSSTDISYGKVEISIDLNVRNRVVDTKEAIIGNITDASVTMDIKELGKKSIPKMLAGETKTVEVTVSGIKDSFKKDSYVFFDVNGAAIPYSSVSIIEPKGKIVLLGESNGKTDSSLINNKEVYKDGKFSMKILDSDSSEIKFKMDVTADYKSSERATMEISSNNFESSKKDIALIDSKYAIEARLSTGPRGTSFKGNDIKIRESKSGTLNTGDKLYLSLSNSQMGFDISDIKIEATSGVELSLNKKNTNGVIELEVLKKSYSAPSVINISGVKIFSLESAVAGIANLEIKSNKEYIYDEPYVQIAGSSNTQSTTIFTIGNKIYTVSGNEKIAVEAPYIKNGYTMLPVRALAESLGLSSSWNNETKTAIFSNKNKIATVKVGAKEMTVNGTPMPLSVPAEVKNGATMIELRSLANGFNVNIEWNNSTKSAIVTNR